MGRILRIRTLFAAPYAVKVGATRLDPWSGTPLCPILQHQDSS
jgi:hypothetical protein